MTDTENGQKTKRRASTKAPNLYQRLLAAGDDVGIIPKTKKPRVPYPTVSHDDVTKNVRPALVAHGIVAFSSVVGSNQDGNRTELTVRTTFVNVDQPEERIEVDTVGYGIGDDDKGPGKAMSYAVKYALLKTLGLETGEDAGLEADATHRRDEQGGRRRLRRAPDQGPKLDLHAAITSYANVQWEDCWPTFKKNHGITGDPTPETCARIIEYLERRHGAGDSWDDVLTDPKEIT